MAVALLILAIVAFHPEIRARRQDDPALPVAPATVAHPGGVLPGNPAIQLVKVADGLADPVTVAAPDDGSGRLFVAERFGQIRIIDCDGQLLAEPFRDPRGEIDTGFQEQGLLGLGFHPDFRANGLFYVAYTGLVTNGDTFVAEYAADPRRPDRAKPGSRRLLLAVDQPFVAHNGGTLRFGPDRMLSVGLGDGGRAGDPLNNAQDRGSLLGKILRIDPAPRRDAPYGIPNDNPFAAPGRYDSPFPGASQAPDRGSNRRNLDDDEQRLVGDAVIAESDLEQRVRPELWALGPRNPWLFAFDPATGGLYLPDVGQRQWEEINVEPAGSVWKIVAADRIPDGAETAPLEDELPATSLSAAPVEEDRY